MPSKLLIKVNFSTFSCDKYVEIDHENINSKYIFSFNKVEDYDLSQFPFDFDLITLYQANAASENGKVIISSKIPDKQVPFI